MSDTTPPSKNVLPPSSEKVDMKPLVALIERADTAAKLEAAGAQCWRKLIELRAGDNEFGELDKAMILQMAAIDSMQGKRIERRFHRGHFCVPTAPLGETILWRQAGRNNPMVAIVTAVEGVGRVEVQLLAKRSDVNSTDPYQLGVLHESHPGSSVATAAYGQKRGGIWTYREGLRAPDGHYERAIHEIAQKEANLIGHLKAQEEIRQANELQARQAKEQEPAPV